MSKPNARKALERIRGELHVIIDHAPKDARGVTLQRSALDTLLDSIVEHFASTLTAFRLEIKTGANTWSPWSKRKGTKPYQWPTHAAALAALHAHFPVPKGPNQVRVRSCIYDPLAPTP